MIKKVLVTGANGQLGKTIKELYEVNDLGLEFIFVSKEDLDITNSNHVNSFFDSHKFDYCLNSAAYTNVDLAESEPDLARKINELGPINLAKACKKQDVVLIHLSTDFVFDGNKSSFYNESDKPNPLNVYGKSKLKGEIAISELLEKYFVIRTSWLYSKFGNNFMKTMLKLAAKNNEIKVVCNQVGSPTYAADLANVLIKLIISDKKSYGIYHYSNEGIASWYDFAKAIFEESHTEIKLIPIKQEEYYSPAKRPSFSVLDKSKIKKELGIEIHHWRDSLKEALLC
ncbi:dTDP-4-dehydrorhamnose reductase [Algibacter luteus]|uniref:dTDP-4-dehydrorhamnose reductase n=1 Tax=Algibacter luteus TaxID=1178825 RepID=A0A1M6DBH4_9FLAO|nr:dTDP-4-dehydrorhamnose reductase [Algibacter luteus]SHI70378.1 dTDP-4-dehydrorhamnose reductase [Algibacter luteus]